MPPRPFVSFYCPATRLTPVPHFLESASPVSGTKRATCGGWHRKVGARCRQKAIQCAKANQNPDVACVLRAARPSQAKIHIIYDTTLKEQRMKKITLTKQLREVLRRIRGVYNTRNRTRNTCLFMPRHLIDSRFVHGPRDVTGSHASTRPRKHPRQRTVVHHCLKHEQSSVTDKPTALHHLRGKPGLCWVVSILRITAPLVRGHEQLSLCSDSAPQHPYDQRHRHRH